MPCNGCGELGHTVTTCKTPMADMYRAKKNIQRNWHMHIEMQISSLLVDIFKTWNIPDDIAMIIIGLSKNKSIGQKLERRYLIQSNMCVPVDVPEHVLEKVKRMSIK